MTEDILPVSEIIEEPHGNPQNQDPDFKGVIQAGVIDLGSSSIKLLIGEVAHDQIRILEFLKNHAPLGRHAFNKGAITQDTTNYTIHILNNYKKILSGYGIKNAKVFATTAVREARNQDIFVDTIARKTGLSVEVLTVGDIVYYIDAYLSYKLQKSYPIHTKNVLIAELGSGSLDISVMKKGFTLTSLGLPLGTVRIKQLLDKLDGSLEENYEAVQEYIDSEFQHLRRAISAIELNDIILLDENYAQYFPTILPHQPQKTNFYQLTKTIINSLSNQWKTMNQEEIARKNGIPWDTASTIVPYMMLLKSFFPLIKNEHIFVLEAPLAEAVLANMLLGIEISKRYNKTNQLISAAHFICQKFEVDLDHAKQVAHLAKLLFEGLASVLGVKRKDLLYLLLAAYLHDIGIFLHNRAHHKHSEYIISCLNLFRMTSSEINIIAAIARYHRKATPRDSHLVYNTLSPEKKILVQKLSALLRIANALDTSHKQKIKDVQVQCVSEQDIKVIVHTHENLMLERITFDDKKDLFEEITGNKISLVQKGLG